MSGSNVQQSNAVWDRITATVEQDARVAQLPEHVSAIADELAASGAFDLDEGNWVLSDRAWTDWLFSGADAKYRP